MNLEFEQKYADRLSSIAVSHYEEKGSPVSCVSCKTGACCRQELRCSESEIDKLAELALKKKVDLNRLRDQALDWENSNKVCVFLEEGRCGIYEDRPIVCRRHLVNTPKENCVSGCKEKANVIYTVEMEERLAEILKKDGAKDDHFQIMQLGLLKRLSQNIDYNELYN